MNKSFEQSLTPEENEILKVFATVIPNLSEKEKARLLWWGEGMAFKVTGNENVLQQKIS